MTTNFVYIGAGKTPPKTCRAYGNLFNLHGDSVKITNKVHIDKLLGNPSFVNAESLTKKEPTKKDS